MTTPDKIQAPLTWPLADSPPGEDIEAMIDRLDKKWRDLKKLLRTEGYLIAEEEAGAAAEAPLVLYDPEEESAAEPDDSWWSHLVSARKAHVDMTAKETLAITQGLEGLGEDKGIQEQLTKVQWQNRGLMVYAVICTVMFLYLMASMLFSQDNLADSASGKGQAAGLQTAAGSALPGPTGALVPAAPVASLQDTAPPAPPLQISGQQGPQTLPGPVSAAKEAQTPGVDYVGSFNSNKYHYRSCKWTKYIGPRNLRVFTSVAEAQKAGYLSCPTCQPPLSDAVQTSAR